MALRRYCGIWYWKIWYDMGWVGGWKIALLSLSLTALPLQRTFLLYILQVCVSVYRLFNARVYEEVSYYFCSAKKKKKRKRHYQPVPRPQTPMMMVENSTIYSGPQLPASCCQLKEKKSEPAAYCCCAASVFQLSTINKCVWRGGPHCARLTLGKKKKTWMKIWADYFKMWYLID